MTEIERLTAMVKVTGQQYDRAGARVESAREEEQQAWQEKSRAGNAYDAATAALLEFAKRGGDISAPADPEAIEALQKISEETHDQA